MDDWIRFVICLSLVNSPCMWHDDADCDGAGGRRVRAPAAVKRAVDEWIDHRVGHTEEEDPQNVAVFDVTHIDKRVDDEEYLIRCPADNESRDDDRRHTEGLHLRFGKHATAHRRRSSPVTLQFHVLR